MRRLVTIAAVLVLIAIAALAAVIALDAPQTPATMKSVSDPFAGVDFSGVPPKQHYAARDGTALVYRAYPGDPKRIVVLIHGSSGTTEGMHLVARDIRARGATVYALAMRGHDGTGRSGDIDYIGQLTDDLADFMAVLRPLHAGASFSLIGFSSGGGFVLRVIASPLETLFDRFIMISPALPPGAPTIRPDTGGWVSIALPRIIALSILNQIGINWFNGLPIIAFATSPTAPNLTSVYSFRLAIGFGATRDYLAAIGRSTKPAALLVGGADELFYPDRFAPLFAPARSDMAVTIVPGVGHIGMTLAPDGVAAVRKAFLALTAPKA